MISYNLLYVDDAIISRLFLYYELLPRLKCDLFRFIKIPWRFEYFNTLHGALFKVFQKRFLDQIELPLDAMSGKLSASLRAVPSFFVDLHVIFNALQICSPGRASFTSRTADSCTML